MDVTVPPGCGAGSSVTFVDAAGCELTTTVPDGLVEGDIFRVAAPIPDWIEEILESLTQDKFSFVLDKYVERECHKFTMGGAGSYTLEQSESHTNYVRLYESRIESHLKKQNATHEQFLSALLAAESAVPTGKRSLCQSLLEVQSFEHYAKLCQQRALEQA